MQKKILIVDDESHIRTLLEQTLEDFEDEGVLILTASNGSEAIEIISSEKPDLVYLDVMMPGKNGFEVCKEVKEQEEFKDIYIVILTAKGQEVDKEKGKDVGANIYMTKPFDPDLIIEKAEEILQIKIS